MVAPAIVCAGSSPAEGQGHTFAQKIYQRQSEIFEAPVCGMSDGGPGGDCVGDSDTRRGPSGTGSSDYLLADLRSGNAESFAKAQNREEHKSSAAEYSRLCIRTCAQATTRDQGTVSGR
jgi:hypothetical protein